MSPSKKAAKKTAKKAVKKAAKKVAKKAAPAKKSAPAKKAAPARKAAPAKKVAARPAPAPKPAPAKKSAAAKKPAPKHAPTGESVDAHISAIADPGRRQDCRTLVEVFSKATGKQPKMWGPSVVAFGKYHYKYASGHEGDSCLAGFASRKGELTLYLTCEPMDRGELMRKLGKHREGKGCVYLKNLDGIDLEVLGELVKLSAETIRRKYPDEG